MPVPTNPPTATLAMSPPPSAARTGAMKERTVLRAKAPADMTLIHLPSHIRSASPASSTTGAGGGVGTGMSGLTVDMQPTRKRLRQHR